MRRRWRAVAGTVGALALLGACTTSEPAPARTGTVVVAVAAPFTSLNGGTAQGRAAGSTLVRSLVQDGFVSLDESGAAVPDAGFGTVEKVADAPLTVRYTIDPAATWSDGTPVTAADLLLEWAARSGQLDDVAPELDAQGEVVNNDALDAGVAFAAASPALTQAQALPVVEGATLTLVYATPVPDWQVALDVNLPAHVLGQTALGVEDAAAAAAAVTKAVVDEDKEALRSVSAAWRSEFEADALAQHVDQAVSTGPYVIDAIVPGERVELVRNEQYAGAAGAVYERVVVRSDLDPLQQAEALAAGSVDVVAPVATPDVLKALEEVTGADVRAGGDSVLQLQLQAAGGGAFDPATYGGDAAVASTVRRAFLLTVPRDAVADVVTPLWPEAAVAGALLPSAAPSADDAEGRGDADLPAARALLTEAGVTDPVVVRVLTNTTDPLRARMLVLVGESAAEAGFEVEEYTATGGLGPDLAGAPEAWDAALVPVPQADLPVESVLARWRTGGATNVTGWTDAATDAAAGALAQTLDPAAADDQLAAVAATLEAGGAVLSLVRQPVVVATRGSAAPTAGSTPAAPDVAPLQLGRADLTSWWAWARAAG
ncbi:ABC transporter substrate-binding protein [uncultured Cellulomonas sp.]|uniref:ABC transporter substrate-binding protein n=1 Tax=uncultured Cellulomonas sp. TaxID=189682 RepID=UPI0028EDC36A|nr:ABC transporter substrate-binding protein [uncultured Cellulomonas sp.]